MSTLQPFFRESGPVGAPGVVCLHSNASSSSQWRTLMDQLAPEFHVLAPDSYGAGKSPPWPTERPLTLSDELSLLEPVFAHVGDGFALVGHSYGAAMALVAAVQQPARIRALLLYEPTLFGLLDAQSPPPNAADGIRAAVAEALEALSAGERSSAAEIFIDYWMGKGAFATRSAGQRASIEATIVNIGHWSRALLGEPTPIEAYRELRVPTLLMVGQNSPPSSRAVAGRLAQLLPEVETVEFDGLGHMAPITHPEPVNAAIASFLCGFQTS